MLDLMGKNVCVFLLLLLFIYCCCLVLTPDTTERKTNKQIKITFLWTVGKPEDLQESLSYLFIPRPNEYESRSVSDISSSVFIGMTEC